MSDDVYFAAKFMRWGQEIIVRPGWSYEKFINDLVAGIPKTGSPKLLADLELIRSERHSQRRTRARCPKLLKRTGEQCGRPENHGTGCVGFAAYQRSLSR